MWYWIMIILLLITVVILSFIIGNLLNQNTQFEKYIKTQFKTAQKKQEDFDKYYQYILGLLMHTYSELQRVDKRGSFSSDDEVGFSFRVIYRAIEDIKNKIELMKIEETEK